MYEGFVMHRIKTKTGWGIIKMLNLKIAHKLPAIIIGSALIVGVAMGLVGL
ncbi:hypothetical protein MNBD_ALPHA11-867, partial [hydrothermal vent metagenome]